MKVLLFKIVFLIIFTWASIQVFAQSDSDKYNFIEAEYDFIYEDYSKALNRYLKVLKAFPDNANAAYRAGLCNLSLGNEKEAINYLKLAGNHITETYREGSYKEKNAPLDVYLYLGQAYRMLYKIDSALHFYNLYLNKLGVDKSYEIDYTLSEVEKCLNAEKMILNPLKVEYKNLGELINNEEEQSSVAVSPDESKMVFSTTSNREIIFYSEKNEDSTWSQPIAITFHLNSSGFFIPCNLSNDGVYMLLRDKDQEKGDLYVSRRMGNRWSQMEKLPKKISSRFHEHSACFGESVDVIYFSSNRKDGMGGLDIYRIEKEAGEWGEPENLGPSINTPWDETNPYMMPDGRTLYFASEGHNNMGGFDIFYSTRIDNEWSSPINIGFPVNTAGDDLWFQPVQKGSAGYFCSLKDSGYGGKDIYRATILPAEQVETLNTQTNLASNTHVSEADVLDGISNSTQQVITDNIISTSNNNATSIKSDIPVITVSGIFSLEDDNDLDITAEIEVYSLNKENLLATLKPDPITGEFSFKTVPSDYNLNFTCRGYKSESKIMSITPDILVPEVSLNVSLTPDAVSTGTYTLVQNIYFESNSYTLNRESQIELGKIYRILDENPTLYIEIVGHTDSLGDKKYNKELSVNRARTVISYLIDKGLSNRLFVGKGEGDNSSIAINSSPEGRRYNRRVEIKLHNADPEKIIITNLEIPDHLRYAPEEISYTILLAEQSSKIQSISLPGVNELFNGKDYIYTVGIFPNKAEAITFLNTESIEDEFPSSRIINNKELERKTKKESGNTVSMKGDYTIQVKALMVPASGNAFSGLASVKPVTCADGLTRYVYGNFKTADEARETLKEVVEKGYADAFIVQKEDLENKISNVASGNPISESEENIRFTIQIAAMTDEVDLEKFAGLEKEMITLYKEKSKQKIFRYTYGTYNNFLEAKREWSRLTQSHQYHDAFIINQSSYNNLIRIDAKK